jgi:hypothetical protein
VPLVADQALIKLVLSCVMFGWLLKSGVGLPAYHGMLLLLVEEVFDIFELPFQVLTLRTLSHPVVFSLLPLDLDPVLEFLLLPL